MVEADTVASPPPPAPPEPDTLLVGDVGREYVAETEIPLLRKAVRISGLDSARAESLFALRERALQWQWDDDSDEPLVDSAYLATLEDWVRRSHNLSNQQRAAALLIADRVLGAGAVSFYVPDGPYETQRRLKAIGAKFGLAPISHEEVHTGNWLREAQALDPAVGDIAAVFRLSGGWLGGVACEGGEEQFLSVIREGEAMLRRLRDPELLAQVHLLLAKAYGDIVAVGSGATSAAEYLDDKPYRARVDEARRRALEHYRAALPSVRGRETIHKVRREAWRLGAGFPPLRTRFVCIYD